MAPRGGCHLGMTLWAMLWLAEDSGARAQYVLTRDRTSVHALVVCRVSAVSTVRGAGPGVVEASAIW